MNAQRVFHPLPSVIVAALLLVGGALHAQHADAQTLGVGEQEASAIVYDTNPPTALGLTITFMQYQWGGTGLVGPGGADGISFFLAAAPPQLTAIGPPGKRARLRLVFWRGRPAWRVARHRSRRE